MTDKPWQCQEDVQPLANGDRDPDLTEKIRRILAKGSYQMPGEALPYESQARAIAEAVAASEVDRWRRRFCPSGKHYKGRSIQSRFDPETRTFARSTFETYDCWDCRSEQRMDDCAHDGDIAQARMAFGYGWECAGCGRYFGHLDAEHDEALALIRAELAAAPRAAPQRMESPP